MDTFWNEQYCLLEQSISKPTIPLARIKKVMKQDCSLMISHESVLLFEKASELFIKELTLRTFTETEQVKRKTLQKCDLMLAISKSDTFDFLIDIVPRDC
jgi:nuclear transcription factor Y, gamma